MALHIRDSFSPYLLGSDGNQNLWDITNFQIDNVNTRFAGGRSIWQTSGVGGSTLLVKSFSRNRDTQWIAFNWLYLDALELSADTLYRAIWWDGDTVQLTADLCRDGSISFKRNGVTEIARYYGAFPYNAWYKFQIKVHIDTTVGYVRVRRHGETADIFAAENLNTQHTGNSRATRGGIVKGSSIYMDNGRFQEVWLWDDDPGDPLNDWIDDLRSVRVSVSADATVQFTPSTGTDNYAMVDENQQDGDTTYVQSNTLNHEDWYGLAIIPESPTAISQIYGVDVRAMVRKTDSGARATRVMLESLTVSSDVAESDDYYLPTTYSNQILRADVDPATGNPWTVADLQLAKIGLKVSV